jgi:pimeloyl-ACP methyl ester carboxylesterase
VTRRAIAASAALAAVHVLAAPPAGAADALSPCRIPGIKHEVLCGRVTRPLDPAAPGGRTIVVHYAVAPAMARNKLPDPVFLLAGGPGQSAINLASNVMPLFARLNNRRDIVFVDQRGTGRSAPLECEDTRHQPLADQADPQAQLTQIRRCREALLKLPHVRSADDLRHYTTTIAMQDLDAVRAQLGAERIDLVGGSYGTRAGLEYLRQFPQHVRRTVLDGVAPPDMALPTSISTDGQAAFDAMAAACEADAACARAHPALRAEWRALLASVPRRVTVTHPLTGQPETFTLTRDMVLGAVRGPLYQPALAAALPQAIGDAARGRFEALAGLNSLFGTRKGTQLAMGMHFAVVCAEDVPRVATASDRPGADFGTDFATLYAQVCADWPRGAVPDAFYRMPAAATPVLLLSGSADPVTPPRHGERVAQALGTKARHVVVPHVGHGVLGGVGCMREVLFRFIDADSDAAALAVDASCAQGVPRPPAYRPPVLASEPSR